MTNYQFEHNARSVRQTAFWITLVLHILVVAAIIYSSGSHQAQTGAVRNEEATENLSANRP